MIAVLEDSELRVRTLRRIARGHHLAVFDRVQPFLAYLGALLERPELLVLDCHVTEGTGLDAARALPTRLRTVPVLVWTDDPDCAQKMVDEITRRGWLADVRWEPFGASTAGVVRATLR